MSLSKNPKDGPIWISKKYRRWIRDNASCQMCMVPLSMEKPGYISHHHRHSGGKYARDQLLVGLCLGCHNKFHANESFFNSAEHLNEQKWLNHVVQMLGAYTETLNINAKWVMINALQQVIEENEK